MGVVRREEKFCVATFTDGVGISAFFFVVVPYSAAEFREEAYLLCVTTVIVNHNKHLVMRTGRGSTSRHTA
jgi:hypothetical protein